jgi:hypothetical protein
VVIRTLGFIIGGAFLFGGALGFVPGVVQNNLYLGVFMVNTPHNFLHIASGLIFLLASFFGPGPARLWFQIFGMLYAVMAAWGFKVGVGMICGVISNNPYDSWGHAGLALGMLLIGFAVPSRSLRPARQ